MTISHDLQEQLSKVDQKIIELLAERIALSKEALEEDEEALSSDYAADTVGEWEAAADERGWNLHTIGKVCRSIVEHCKAMTED